ncbi:MAG: polysaccharide pyruvyl transferase family protein [Clostridiales bacterium]|nr:polysaccharide pyruvyl transferase family protein [Clostridiales bacterium]
MKIGLLTHYNVINQGAQLQMIAMKQYLEHLGHDVFILTYDKDFSFLPYEKKKNSASLLNSAFYIREYFVKKGIGLTLFNIKKVYAHKKILRKLMKLHYDSADIDCVIIGSDEVFSIDVGCNKMMYGYGLKAPAIAYAPSFGITTEKVLKDYSVYDIVKNGLSSLYALSARDSHTRELIESMTGREVPLVCDPVFFYQGAIKTKVNIRKPFLLVYSYDRNMRDKREVAETKMFAQKHNLLTVSCGTYHKWCDMNISCDAEEWYSYFEKAAYVLTDTFHGTVVSIIKHVNVAVVIRNEINPFKLMSLLNEAGLNNRLLNCITATNLEKVFTDSIDFNAVDYKIAKMKEISVSYLNVNLRNLNV